MRKIVDRLVFPTTSLAKNIGCVFGVVDMRIYYILAAFMRVR